MRNKIYYSIVDISPHIGNIEKGEGFYSACKNEIDKNSKPARKVINGLKEIIALIGSPRKHNVMDINLKRFYDLSKRIMDIYGIGDYEEYIREFKRKINFLCDNLWKEKIGYEHNFSGIRTDGLSDEQKSVIYNMLVANGASHEEALNEILNF